MRFLPYTYALASLRGPVATTNEDAVVTCATDMCKCPGGKLVSRVWVDGVEHPTDCPFAACPDAGSGIRLNDMQRSTGEQCQHIIGTDPPTQMPTHTPPTHNPTAMPTTPPTESATSLTPSPGSSSSSPTKAPTVRPGECRQKSTKTTWFREIFTGDKYVITFHPHGTVKECSSLVKRAAAHVIGKLCTCVVPKDELKGKWQVEGSSEDDGEGGGIRWGEGD
jgi:hypothetical protein